MPNINVQAVIDAANVKRKGKEVRLTRRLLARMLGTSKQTLTNYQSGRVPRVINQLLIMTKESGLSIDEIINLSEEEANTYVHADSKH